MRKYKIEEADKIFSDKGFKLLSKKYQNSKTLLKYICSCGEIAKKRLSNVLIGEKCSKCSGNKKYTIKEVNKIFSDRGCKLLSKEYKNNKLKLDYICFCGNKSKISLNSFLVGQECMECGIKRSADAHRYSYEQAINLFKERGCILLSKKYFNISTPLNYICSCGNKSQIRLGSLLVGHKCKKCGSNRLHNKICFTCKNNYIGKALSKYCSIKCDPKDRITKLTDNWREKVFNRDNYKCQVCNKEGGKLNAHHLENYKYNIKLRYEVNNGVTLCKEEHKELHRIYKYKTNKNHYLLFKVFKKVKNGLFDYKFNNIVNKKNIM